MERPVVIGSFASVHKLRRLYWRFTSQDCRRTGLGHEKSTRLLCSQTVHKRTENRVWSTTTCRSSDSMREGQGQGLSVDLLLCVRRIYVYYRNQSRYGLKVQVWMCGSRLAG